VHPGDGSKRSQILAHVERLSQLLAIRLRSHAVPGGGSAVLRGTFTVIGSLNPILRRSLATLLGAFGQRGSAVLAYLFQSPSAKGSPCLVPALPLDCHLVERLGRDVTGLRV